MAGEIRKVAVIGGGTMGGGIAQLVAQKGIQVVVKEASDERAQTCKNRIFTQLDKVVRLGKIDLHAAENAKSHFSATGSYDEIKDADLVIEAVFEDLNVKKTLFGEIESLFPGNVIFTTNSSSLSIDEIASATKRPDRFIGTHFFNPPAKAPLVELVSGQATSKETFETIQRFIKTDLGKTPIFVKGCPGYLVNRLLLPYLNEAAHLLTETTLTVRQIDSRAEKFGWPMGPFALLDYVGIDIAANVADILFKGYGERAKPVPFMRRLVELGRIGNKAGAGFSAGVDKSVEDIQMLVARECPNKQELDIEEGFKRMMAGLYNEAFLCLEEDVASAGDIETGATLGIMFPMSLEGPLHCAQDKYGFSNLLSDLERFERECGPRFKPAVFLERLVAENGNIFEKVKEEEW